MDKDYVSSLVERIKESKYETDTVEVKSAKDGAPKVYDTLSSFSNQSKGGTIVFGIDESEGFSLCGVYDLKDLQDRLSEQCEEMEPRVLAEFVHVYVEGKAILAMAIPPMEYSRRPCYRRSSGIKAGSFVRLGQFDKRMNEYEINSYLTYRKKEDNDLREIEDERASAYLNKEKIARFILDAKIDNPKASGLTDDELENLLGLRKNGLPTLSSVIVFSLFPQAVFPQLLVTATLSNSYLPGEMQEDGTRFVSSKDIRGNVEEMIDGAVSFIMQNAPSPVSFSNGRRVNQTTYDPTCVREAIINAIVHRDYGPYMETSPIRIEMYKDRLEIISPGGLYGDYDVDDLGNSRIPPRNPNLINILSIMKVIENRYSGIPTLYRICEEKGLPAPVFKNERGYFKVIFYNSGASILNKAEAGLVEFCKAPRSREEIASFLGVAPYYAMKKYVEPLLSKGYLEYEDPSKKRSKFMRIVATGVSS